MSDDDRGSDDADGFAAIGWGVLLLAALVAAVWRFAVEAPR